ncbi:MULTISPECIES: methylated-DNA--[protein]-cysteine S-methyltransferase [Campylobacter]|uniref:methylated-DNA--[protein]-cysteine S-methyltransferase n=1 Tax=Campylobacter TaxID=194 RepID=UPI0014763E85|nr:MULTISPECIES: methylated-DNA--[protein]-cysteine S-methyltransferase [unclassified Campylobacter]MBE3610544.1 methylated-DNA--[protein]-cysteine S-methyltransferase [Campylobacter sp. RM12916]
MDKAYFSSLIGILEILGDKNGISEINFVDKFIKTDVKEPNLKLCLDELEEYFSGKLKNFSVRLNIQATPFQKSVYKALLNIPYGTTATYSDVAKMIHNQKAQRAVGSANAKNKIPIIIPCHRVVGANSLGGYSGAGGLKTKEILLNLEKGNLS